jgi:PTH2 family peptidyl-tRNA hydrolase
MARKLKQVIVIRKDLSMRRGKECAQVSHASMAFLVERIRKVSEGFWPNSYNDPPEIYEILQLTLDQYHWMLDNLNTKVVLQAKSEDELVEVERLCREAGLETHLIKDAGLTATGEGLKGVATYTTLGIGPNDAEEIDRITGVDGSHPLKLY